MARDNLLFILDIVVDSWLHIYFEICEFVNEHLIPDQLRFTESKKDFLVDLLFIERKKDEKSFITIQINQSKILCTYYATTVIYELLIVLFSHFSYVFQYEQLLKFIQCDEVIPVVNLEEVDCQFYLLWRSTKPLLMDDV